MKTVLYVKSKDMAFEKIRTSTDKRVWLSPKTSIKKGTENQESSTHALERIDTDWLPDNIVSSLQEHDDYDIQSVFETVDNETMANSNHSRNTHTNCESIAFTEAIESHLDEIDIFAIIAQEQSHENVLTRNTFLDVNGFISNTVLQFPKSDEKTRKHWSTLLMKDVESKLKSKTSFACLTKNEINVICRGLKSVLPTTITNKKVSWKFLELF